MKEKGIVIALISLLVISSAYLMTTKSSNKCESSSDWEGVGGGTINVATPPTPVITSVTFDQSSITPGAWVTITVRAKNNGGVADRQAILIGLPCNTLTSDIQISSHDLSEINGPIPPNTEIYAGYGAYKIKSKYILIEGNRYNWGTNEEHYITIKVKFPDTDTFAIDVKTIAFGAGTIKYDPASGMVDQQDEYVKVYLIFKKFTISVGPGGTNDANILITNHVRTVSGKVTQPSLVVNTFTVTNSGGFSGTIQAINLPLTIAPGTTGTLKVRVNTPSTHPLGTYTIQYKVSGTP